MGTSLYPICCACRWSFLSRGTPIPAPWIEQVRLLVFLLWAPVCTPSAAPAGGVSSLEELPFPPLGSNRLGCWFFFYGHQFVPHLLRLPVEFPLSRNSHSRPLDRTG